MRDTAAPVSNKNLGPDVDPRWVERHTKTLEPETALDEEEQTGLRVMVFEFMYFMVFCNSSEKLD